ncbi:RHS repeat-associated core domain-containing protein [Pseudomonas huaxiensis]|uniref:RHS repeat-associated core domain-containing protein n=1 Tax=Pseudomonas huaxiensis TaxID=2213017 RepID=UPI001CDC06A7|nr:RHS repeat-associated core domain-containing protein [Pseudomonas huaxiensis]
MGAQARVLRWTAGRPEQVPNDQVRYQVDDHLGSVALEFDGQARLLTSEVFYPFGGTAIWAGSNAVQAGYKSRRFSGKERDATGLYYFGLRYYAPWLSRWINPDPLGEVDGLNLFRMVRNNPLSLRDRDGGEAIPSEAHFYWGGSSIPPEYLYNVLMFQELNPEWQVNMWVTRPMQLESSFIRMEQSMDAMQRDLAATHGKHLKRRDPAEVFSALRESAGVEAEKLHGIFLRESNGAYQNHAAASDVFRLAVLHAYGGMYMDMDVAVGGAIDLGEGSSDFLVHAERRSISNAVLAAVSGTETTRRLLKQVVHEYSPASSKNEHLPEVAWTTKRHKAGEGLFSRMKLTMFMTGPSMIRATLGEQRLLQDAPRLPAGAFYGHRRAMPSDRPQTRDLSQMSFGGYETALFGEGNWGSVRPGRRSSVA